MTFNLIKNVYPPFVINQVIKEYLDRRFSSNQNQLKDTSEAHYFQLPYIRNVTHRFKNKIYKFYEEFCKKQKIEH